MFEFGRVDQLFQIVRGSAFTPARKLAELLGVTDRTIRSDVSAANSVLERNGARISMKRGSGYYLDVSDPEAFGAFIAEYQSDVEGHVDLSSPSDRQRMVLKTLVCQDGYIPMSKLADEVFVAEDTLAGYVKQARETMQSYDIECVFRKDRGFRTFGREIDRRRCLVNEVVNRDDSAYVVGFTPFERNLFAGLDLSLITNIVKSALSESGVTATDYGLKNLLVHTALMALRVRQGFLLEGAAPVVPADAQKVVGAICGALEERFSLRLPERERAWYYRHLAVDTSVSVAPVDCGAVALRVDGIIDLIEENYGFDLHADTGLRDGLLSHLISILQGRNLVGSKANPLLNTIRRSFPLAYEVSLVSVNEAFECDGISFTEEEIGYIALHVGAAIERRMAAREDVRRVLLVCGSGRAASGMLETRVSTLFSGSIEIAETVSYQGFLSLRGERLEEFDFIISTVPLKESPVPSILVDFRLSAQDVKSISKYIELSLDSTFSHVEKFFSRSLFMVVEDPVSKDELLRLMSDGLVRAGVADEGLYASVMEREGVASTALSETIALPHPMKPCAEVTRVSVALVRRPIRWTPLDTSSMSLYSGVDYTGARVQVVFLLAMQPTDSADIAHLYDLLIKIMDDARLAREVAAARSFDEFVSALKKAC